MPARSLLYQFLVGGGIIAGGSGLVLAGRTVADVEQVKQRVPVISARLIELEKSVSSLSSTVVSLENKTNDGLAGVERQLESVEELLEETRERILIELRRR